MSVNEVQSMIEALGEEILAVAKRGGSRRLEVTGGEAQGQTGDHYLYAFILPDPNIRIQDDSPLRITVDGSEADGFVASFQEDTLVIAVENDFGPRIAAAVITFNDTFLLEQLKSRLTEVEKGSVEDFNDQRAKQLMGLAESAVSHQSPDPALVGIDPPLNSEQERAIAQALGSEILYLWGPPGTGKTTVVGRMVADMYLRGKSVLILSNTNVAVDTALRKVVECIPRDSGLADGKILRYGPVVDDELRKHSEYVDVDRVVARRTEELQEKLVCCKEERAKVSAELRPLEKRKAAFDELQRLKDENEQAQGRLDQLPEEVRLASNREKQFQRRINQVQTKIQQAQRMGSIRRLLAGLNESKLWNENRILNQQLEQTQSERKRLQSEKQQREQRLAEANARCEKGRKAIAIVAPCSNCGTKCRFHPVPGSQKPVCGKCRSPLNLTGILMEPCTLAPRIQTLRNKVSELDAAMKGVQEEINEVRTAVMNECRILAATVYRTFLKGQISRTFDVVIVDEASMLALPMVYYAAGRAEKQVIVAGDFRQLPPIVISDDELPQKWLKQDVFHHAGIVTAVEQNRTPQALVQLKSQYRMTESICAPVNSLYYRGQLVTRQNEKPGGNFANVLGDSSLVYVDTTSLHPWASYRMGGFSRYNIFHALVTVGILTALRDRGALGRADRGASGVITPYSAQSHLISKLISDAFGATVHVPASTVHQFQGKEKDSILIDLVDSMGCKPSRFLQAQDIDEDGARLLNVALSRPRKHLVLIANFGYLREKLPPSSIVRRVLDHFEKNASRLDPREFLPGYDELPGLTGTISPPSIEFSNDRLDMFNEKSFYPAFSEDLNGAEEFIVVFSPFLTPRGTSRYACLAGQTDGWRRSPNRYETGFKR